MSLDWMEMKFPWMCPSGVFETTPPLWVWGNLWGLPGRKGLVFFLVPSLRALFPLQVVQLYLRWGEASVPVPRWQLVGFRRVLVPQGQATKVPFLLSFRQRAVWAGEWRLEPSSFSLFAGGQQPFQETRVPSNVLRADFSVSGSARKRSQC